MKKLFNIFQYFHYTLLIYGLVISLTAIYFIGAFHYYTIENNLKVEEVIYSNLLKNEIREKIEKAIKTNRLSNFEKEWEPYMNRLAIMIQDYYNFKMYFDSHEKYKFIQLNESIDNYTITNADNKYEINIYSIEGKSWDSIYIHWLKYFLKSFRPTNKYRYLTNWLLIIYPVSILILIFYRAKRNRLTP